MVKCVFRRLEKSAKKHLVYKMSEVEPRNKKNSSELNSISVLCDHDVTWWRSRHHIGMVDM